MLNPPSPEPEIPSSTGSPADAPAHFDELLGDKPSITAPAAPPNMLSKEEFHKVFIGGFKAGHHFTGFKSLLIKPDREGKAEACSHALYETIVDCPSLHFMLTPQSKWWGRAFAIGAFMVPTAAGIALEIKARRTPPPPPQPAEPAQPMDFTAAKAATMQTEQAAEMAAGE